MSLCFWPWVSTNLCTLVLGVFWTKCFLLLSPKMSSIRFNCDSLLPETLGLSLRTNNSLLLLNNWIWSLKHLLTAFVCMFVYLETGSYALCSPGTLYTDQTGLRSHRALPAFAFWALEVKECATSPNFADCFFYNYLWLVQWRTNWGRAIPYLERVYRHWGFNSVELPLPPKSELNGKQNCLKHTNIIHGMTGMWNQEEMYKISALLMQKICIVHLLSNAHIYSIQHEKNKWTY